MKKWLIVLLAFFLPTLNADSWLPGAQLIPQGASAGVSNDVGLAYDAGTKQIVAAWADTISSLPYYALFNGTSWTTAALIPLGSSGSTGVKVDVVLIYAGRLGKVVGAWGDNLASQPYYSLFDGTNWTTAAIPPGTSAGVRFDVYLAFDPIGGTLIAAWSNIFNQQPYYSVFDGTDWTTAPIPLTGSTSMGALQDVTLTFDPAKARVIAAWADAVTNAPFYSLYNGTSWTTPAMIPSGASTGARVDVSLVNDSSTGKIVAAWSDNITQLPYYSLFDGTNWTTAATIPTGASSGVYQNVGLAYNPVTMTVFAAWQDTKLPSSLPYYSIFNGTSWTTGAIPPGTSAGADFNVNLAFDTNSSLMIAAWGNFPGSPNPYYSSYLTTPITPTNLHGKQLKNDFGVVSERYNQIKWLSSQSPGVVGYNIYRNGSLIATVSLPTLHYDDHDRKKGVPTTYTVTAVDKNGNESTPITIEIR